MNADAILKRLEGRQSRWGIGRAARYLEAMEPYAEDAKAFAEVLKQAEGKLVYTDPDCLVDEKAIGGERLKAADDPTPGAVMTFKATITTTRRDRDGDVLESEGARPDMLGPLLWNHNTMEPIGKPLSAAEHSQKRYVEELAIINSPLGRDIAQLVDFGALRRMSHGFLVDDDEDAAEEMADKEGRFLGWHILAFEIMERSIVSVASNTDAVITAYSRDKLCTPMVKGWAGRLFDERPVIVRGAVIPGAPLPPELAEELEKNKGESTPEDVRVALGNPDVESPKGTLRITNNAEKPFTKSVGSIFDVWREHLEPASLEYDWVSRYIGCQVKHLFWVRTTLSQARIGSWLTGLREVLSDYLVEDTRNISSGGDELPPKYEIIQLTPDKSKDFLIQGMEFRCGADRKFVVGFEPYWGHLEVTFYTSDEEPQRDFAREIIDKTWDWSRTNNFLKGHAFSLTGGFLDKTDEQWDGLFLPERNKAPVTRAVRTLNEKRAKTPNRGMILAGPPGTGKTLSARIMRNTANATFVWVAARDFWNAGMFGGITGAFDLAKELAPTIVCFEDVDSWMGSYGSEELLKSEMDGIGRSAGILTLLTTNFPERIPEALIDRPGRFHDVLMFDLPDAKMRAAMLAAWLPEAPEKSRRKTTDALDGYSGAHIYELVQYAKTIAEEEALKIGDALIKAVEKIEAQRDLINGIQLEGSRYKPERAGVANTKAFAFGNQSEKQTNCWTTSGDGPDLQPTSSSGCSIKGTVPGDPSGGSGEGEEGEWSKPNLSDFTDKMWEDCSMMERRKIAKHYAWYSDLDSFGSLKLPHHFPASGKPSLNGVRNALARANQVDGIGGDLDKVRAHLQAHMPKSADGEAKELLATLKSGRTLSKANETRLRDARGDIGAILDKESTREIKALARSAAANLDTVLEAVAGDDEGKQATATGKGKAGLVRALQTLGKRMVRGR